MSPDSRTALGKRGEELACRELCRRGYTILDRRHRTRAGELDIIASQNGTIVFVEVKTRVSNDFGAPADAVTRWKQRRICAMAADYLARKHLAEIPCRFDVVAINYATSDKPMIEIIANAFDYQGGGFC